MAYEGLATVGACTKGDLPEHNQNDIYCPLMGGADYKYKFNYVSASCLERQRYDGCSAKDCKHFKTNIVKKKSIEPKARVYAMDEVVHGKKSAVCAECHQIRPIHGRGCCGGCYMHLQKAGTLDAKHPAKQGGRKKIKPTAQEASMGTNKTIAACAQCDREMGLIARGLCGKCYNQHKKAGTLDEKYPAARLVRFKGDSPAPEPVVDTVFSEPMPTVTAAPETGFKPVRLLLSFGERDMRLVYYLNDWALAERRSVEDQIMCIVDQGVTDRINGSPA